MDCVTALPLTAKGHDAIVVMVDRFSKQVHIGACRKDSSASDLVHIFNAKVVANHGMPVKVLTDRGRQFNNAMTNELWQHMGVRQALTSAFHPQSDGQTEKSNQLIEEVLRHYTAEDQRQWDDYLFMVEYAINSHVHSSTGFAPYQLVMGYIPPSPFDRVFGLRERSQLHRPDHLSREDWAKCKNDLLQQHMAKMQAMWAAAKKALQRTAAQMCNSRDSTRRPHRYKVGDWVMLSTRNLKLTGITVPKLAPRWIGPFRITALVGREPAQAVQLELPPHSRVHNVFHVSLTTPFKGEMKSTPTGGQVPVDVTDPVWVEGDVEYLVERILGHRTRNRGRNATRREFLVKWDGYGPEMNTWEPEANLTCDNTIRNLVLDRYLLEHGLAPTVLTEQGVVNVHSLPYGSVDAGEWP
jgi:hypothetical protein